MSDQYEPPCLILSSGRKTTFAEYFANKLLLPSISTHVSSGCVGRICPIYTERTRSHNPPGSSASRKVLQQGGDSITFSGLRLERRQSAECSPVPDTIQIARVTLRRSISTELCIETVLTIQFWQVRCQADTVQNDSVQCQPCQKIILMTLDYFEED